MKAVVLGFLLVALANCASYTDDIKELRSDYVGGKYQASLEKIDKSALRSSSNNRLLYHMEKAMILDRLDDRKGSRALLMDADKIVDELYTTSISKTAATFIVNESMSDYEGEDYEKVAIHTQLALSFLEDQKLKEARVEAKKINLKLHEITQNYDPKYLHYKEDAFARFLSGLVYESLKNWDDAIIDYTQALEVYTSSDYSKFFEGAVPEALVKSLYGVAKIRKRSQVLSDLRSRYPAIIEKYEASLAEYPQGGDVVVIHETGNITTKQVKDFFLPVSDQIVRLSFPYIDKQSIDWINTMSGLTVDGRYYAASNALNLNALAYRCLEDRRGRLIAKGIARLLLKGQITDQARQHFGVLGWLAGTVYSAVSETADTRGWTLLPQAFYVSRVRMAPGKHNLEIKTASKVADLKSIQIENGDLQLIRSKG